MVFRTIAKLSMATNLTAEGAAIDFARLSNIIGKPISEVEELGNVIVHLGNNMAAQETEIMEFAKRIAGVGTQMGMTEQDILALSAALPALGLRAEMGGTAITRIMVELNAAVTEGTEKLGIFAQTAGMSAEEFAAAWRANPADTLLEFTAGIGRMSDEGADAFATIADLDLSMIRTQDTALRLAGGTEIYARAQALANEETDRQAALQIEVDKRMRTTESQWKILKNNVREAALEIGGPLNESLGRTLTLLNDIWSGRPEGGIAGAIAEAMPGGTLFGQDPLTGDDRNLMDAVIAGFQNAVDPGGGAREFQMAVLSARAEAGRQSLSDAEARNLAALGAQADQYVDGLLGRDRGQEAHIAAMTAQADQYVDSLLRAAAANSSAADSADEHAGVLEGLRAKMEDSREMADRLSDGFHLLAGVNISAERAAIRVTQGFEDLTATLADNEVTLDMNTEAGRNNRTAIMDQTDAIIDEVKQRYEQGESIGRVMARYDEHIDTLRDVLREAGYTEEAIESYIETLGLTPEEIRTAILIDDFASQTIEDYIARLGRVPRRIVTQLQTQASIGGSLSGDQSGLRGHTGGYVHPSGEFQHFHSGGMVGGLRQDEVPAILQTGEMVLNRNQVAQIGAAFSNARERFSAPIVRGGDGNTVSIQQTFAADVSRETLAEARHQQRIAFIEAV